MTPETEPSATPARLPLGASGLVLDLPVDGPARILLEGTAPGEVLVELFGPAFGRRRSGSAYVETEFGARLSSATLERARVGDAEEVRLQQRDEGSALEVTSVFRVFPGAGLQSWTEVTNRGSEPLVVEALSSFAGSVLPAAAIAAARLWSAASGWLAENRWQERPIRDLLPDVHIAAHHQDPRSRYFESSSGSWSTGDRLPVAVLVSADCFVGWQIENNGSWYWELTEHRAGLAVGLYGPTAEQHGAAQTVPPGATLRTVPVSVVVGRGGADEAFAALTRQRRALRATEGRELPGAALPLIYNDFLNTLMGNPTTERVLPLVAAAADFGADVYCIDAGWYDQDGDWWTSVGEWEESRHRFPGGLREVTDAIRARGMVAGLWLEPEVIGVRSPLAERLPEDAFFQRNGVRVREQGRYHLDLRSPAARRHLDDVVDRLVRDYGVGYLKLDYNIPSGAGTDLDGTPGAGLLGHGRALLDWLDGVQDRHPGLLLENCASGAMRADYAMLARLHLQSTSDQQDPILAAPIAAAAPASILPEQAGNWASPQPRMSDARLAWSVAVAAAGRMYLSGPLHDLSDQQQQTVRDAIAVQRDVLAALPTLLPSWPLGLPAPDATKLALMLRGAEQGWLVCWLHPGAEAAIDLGSGWVAEVVFPRQDARGFTMRTERDSVTVTSVADEPVAGILRLEKLGAATAG